MGSLALFHAVHRNFGPDGPSASTFGIRGSILIDCKVDVGCFFVAEGRAGWGRVKNAAFPNILSKLEDSIKENRVWKIVCGKMCAYFANLLNLHQIAHVHVLHVLNV